MIWLDYVLNKFIFILDDTNFSWVTRSPSYHVRSFCLMALSWYLWIDEIMSCFSLEPNKNYSSL